MNNNESPDLDSNSNKDTSSLDEDPLENYGSNTANTGLNKINDRTVSVNTDLTDDLESEVNLPGYQTDNISCLSTDRCLYISELQKSIDDACKILYK